VPYLHAVISNSTQEDQWGMENAELFVRSTITHMQEVKTEVNFKKLRSPAVVS